MYFILLSRNKFTGFILVMCVINALIVMLHAEQMILMKIKISQLNAKDSVCVT